MISSAASPVLPPMNDADPINPQRVFWELSPRLPDDCILTADSGSSANWFARDLGIRRGMTASRSGNAFGFEATRHAASMAVGERVLLPAVRAARLGDLIVADGFSCREQIAQATARRALHLADVVHLAMTCGPRGPDGELPERARMSIIRARD